MRRVSMATRDELIAALSGCYGEAAGARLLSATAGRRSAKSLRCPAPRGWGGEVARTDRRLDACQIRLLFSVLLS